MNGIIEPLFINPPSLINFFTKVMPQDFLDAAQELLNENALTPSDELSVEEVFDYLSSEGFNFLFPKILQAYLDKVFVFDGNLASKFIDAIWRESMGLDRKYSRGNRSDKFAIYADNLSPEHHRSLNTIIESLNLEFSGEIHS